MQDNCKSPKRELALAHSQLEVFRPCYRAIYLLYCKCCILYCKGAAWRGKFGGYS